jgi:hypothetical protein
MAMDEVEPLTDFARRFGRRNGDYGTDIRDAGSPYSVGGVTPSRNLPLMKQTETLGAAHNPTGQDYICPKCGIAPLGYLFSSLCQWLLRMVRRGYTRFSILEKKTQLVGPFQGQ